MCGPEDGHEAARPTGAPRGSGLSPANDRNPERLKGAEAAMGAAPAGFYCAYTSRTTRGKDFTLEPQLHLRPTVL